MSLNKNWITEKLIDFEYKKYILLAFLKEVSDNFEYNKLYPHLSELVEHYRQVLSIKENKQNLLNAFPQKIQKFNIENFKISYEKIIQDDSVMNEIESIIDFSIPQFQHHLNEGKKIYDYIEEKIHISSVGLIPMNTQFGYMLLNDRRETKAYEYQITIFEQSTEKHRGIHTTYIKSYANNISNTFETIKSNLIKENKGMPNPAAFAIESEIELPFQETFLPIAKRSLVKYVSSIS